MSDLEKELRILQYEKQALCNMFEMSQKQNDIYHSSLVEIMNLSSSYPMINDIARKALASTGTTGCPAGPIGVNGLTKEELEGSGDE